jgi:hypothetical protein
LNDGLGASDAQERILSFGADERTELEMLREAACELREELKLSSSPELRE